MEFSKSSLPSEPYVPLKEPLNPQPDAQVIQAGERSGKLKAQLHIITHIHTIYVRKLLQNPIVDLFRLMPLCA